MYLHLQRFQRLSLSILCCSKVLTADSVPSRFERDCLPKTCIWCSQPVKCMSLLCYSEKHTGLDSG